MYQDCPCCHDKENARLEKVCMRRSGKPGNIYLCGRCGMLYPRPRMNEAESLLYTAQRYSRIGIDKMHSAEEEMRGNIRKRWVLSRGHLLNMAFLLRRRVRARRQYLRRGDI